MGDFIRYFIEEMTKEAMRCHGEHSEICSRGSRSG